MSNDKPKSAGAARRPGRSVLPGLTPAEAEGLRVRFGIDMAESTRDEDEDTLRVLSREIARLRKPKKQ